MGRIFASFGLLMLSALAALSLSWPAIASTQADARSDAHHVAEAAADIQLSEPISREVSAQPQSQISPNPGQTSNPANPGTGETAEAEGTRLNLAPYVLGAIVVLAVAVAVIWWRRRGKKTVV